MLATPPSRSWDVIVVGAGPAGSTLARALGGRGHRVLVLEKARLPRYKTCAGGVTARAAGLLDFDFLPAVEDVAFGLRISYRHGSPITRTCLEPLVYLVMRDRFDELLARKAVEAGAVLQDCTNVRGLTVEAGGIKIHTDGKTFTARVVVGADGAGSTVARQPGLSTAGDTYVAVNMEVPCGNAALGDWRGLIHVNYGSPSQGYGWVFPKANHLSTGVCSTYRQARRLRAGLAELARRWGLGDLGEARLRGSILSVRRDESPIVRGRCLLVGDAAGLLDATTGEGIYYAIRSAQLAAPAIDAYLCGNENALVSYQDSIDRELMPDIRLSQKLAAVAGRMPRALFEFFATTDMGWKAACRILRGETQYRRLRWDLTPFHRFLGL